MHLDKIKIPYQDAACISSLSLEHYTSTSSKLSQELKQGILYYFNNKKYSCQRSSRPDYIILIKPFYGDYSFDKEVETYIKCYTCHTNSLTEEYTEISSLSKENYPLGFEILDKDSTLIYAGSISHSSRDKVRNSSDKFFSCMGDETKPKYKNIECRFIKKSAITPIQEHNL